jgi:hypothetical protein
MNYESGIAYKLFLFVMITSSLSFQCNSSGGSTDNITKTNASSNPYFPINSNSKWQYVNEAGQNDTDLFNVKVTGIKNDGKDETVIFDSFPFFTKQIETTTIRIKPTGEVYVTGSDSKENILMPGPENYKKGYYWQYGEWTAYINGTDETVITEKKTYEHCLFIGYSLGGITFSTELWFSKDAGIVKWGANRTNPPILKPVYYILK